MFSEVLPPPNDASKAGEWVVNIWTWGTLKTQIIVAFNYDILEVNTHTHAQKEGWGE